MFSYGKLMLLALPAGEQAIVAKICHRCSFSGLIAHFHQVILHIFTRDRKGNLKYFEEGNETFSGINLERTIILEQLRQSSL